MRRSLALLLAVVAIGCGPVLATSVVDDAEVALARAHAADGEKYALYETTLADLLVVKAKEEQGHAHYSEARDLAGDALQNAEAATRKAAERTTSADAPPMPTATVQHPETSAGTPVKPPSRPPAEPQEPRTVQQPGPPPPPAVPAAPPERKPKAPIDPGHRP